MEVEGPIPPLPSQVPTGTPGILVTSHQKQAVRWRAGFLRVYGAWSSPPLLRAYSAKCAFPTAPLGIQRQTSSICVALASVVSSTLSRL